MADQPQPDSPGAFVNGVRASVRDEVEQEYSSRLRAMHEQIREAQDLADAQRICASQEKEQMAARMGEYRRGKWYHLGAVIAGAASGFGMGYLAQKNLDVRTGGVPVTAVAGVPVCAWGLVLDESFAARATLAVGGAMFSVGSFTFAKLHPLPPGEDIV